MNKTESARAVQLEAMRLAGEIDSRSAFEAITLRLGHDLRYTPDFFITLANNWPRFEEVKGPYMREDARVKLYAAAAAFPMFDFHLVQRRKGERAFAVTLVRT